MGEHEGETKTVKVKGEWRKGAAGIQKEAEEGGRQGEEGKPWTLMKICVTQKGSIPVPLQFLNSLMCEWSILGFKV